MNALLAPQLDTAYELRLGDSILGKRKADEALYALKTQFKPQSAGTFKAGSLRLDPQRNQVNKLAGPLITLSLLSALFSKKLWVKACQAVATLTSFISLAQLQHMQR